MCLRALSSSCVSDGSCQLNFIGAGSGERGKAAALPTKLLGEQVVHPVPPIFFCNLHLKVTLQTP